MSATAAVVAVGDGQEGRRERILDFIERVGNKVPHPAVLFLPLCAGIIVLSQLLAWTGREGSPCSPTS